MIIYTSATTPATDVTTYFKLVDPSTGVPETGLTITDLDATYVRDRAAAVKADLTALAAVDSAHGDNQAKEVDGTNAPGLYRVDWPDAAFAAGVSRVQLVVNGAAIDPAVIEVELLTPVDELGYLKPTTAGRTLDVSATGEAGIDWANVGSPTTTVGLSGTTVKTATDVETDTDAIAGYLVSDVGPTLTEIEEYLDTEVAAILAAVDTEVAAIKTKTDYLPSATAGAAGGVFIAGSNAATSITTALTANITGNLSGSVGSVTGAVGSVTGAVGSVTGAVGSVTGSVGSVASGGITATSIATNAIDADALAADAVAEIADGVWDEVIPGAHVTNNTAGKILLTAQEAVSVRSGTLQAGSAAGTAILDTGASALDEYYNHNLLVINGGTGAGQVRTIQDYTGSSKTCDVIPNWVTTPDVTSTFEILAMGEVHAYEVHQGVTLADDAITSAKFDESTAYPVKSADTGATQIARVGADSDTLETLSDQIDLAATALALANLDGDVADVFDDVGGVQTTVNLILADTNELQVEFVDGGRLDLLIDAIKAKTDNLPTDPADDSDIDAQLATIAGYLDTEIAAILADTNELQVDLVDGGRLDLLIDAIKAKTDLVPASPAAVGSAMALEAAAVDAVLDEVIEGTVTLRHALRLFLAVLAGKSSGGGTASITFRDNADAKARVSATVDVDGNRTAITLDPT